VSAVRAWAAVDDAALVRGACDGDAAMFAELYRRHVDRAFARLTRLVGPVPEREDLLQHVFLDLHRALPRFRGDASIGTFLYQIVVNVAYEHLGRRRRQRMQPLEDADVADLLAPGGSPETRAQRRQDLVSLFDLLGRVKPKKRVAFVLVAVEGMSYEEASTVLGATPDAVKQRVLAARRELNARLERRAR